MKNDILSAKSCGDYLSTDWCVMCGRKSGQLQQDMHVVTTKLRSMTAAVEKVSYAVV